MYTYIEKNQNLTFVAGPTTIYTIVYKCTHAFLPQIETNHNPLIEVRNFASFHFSSFTDTLCKIKISGLKLYIITG